MSAPSRRRYLVLIAAFLGWMFAGLTMSILPLIVRPAMLHFLPPGPGIEATVGRWLAWYTCAFLLGAAAGGALFGWLGDRVGRVKAMGLSILCYSLFNGIGSLAATPEALLVLRFLACLGVGGIWPNGVALVSEVWSDVSRPTLAGLIGTAANVGFVLLGLLALRFEVTPESWRWVLLVGAAPALLGVFVLLAVPESPRWLASRNQQRSVAGPSPLGEVFRPPLVKATLIGICLGTVPVVGNWGGANWLVPWSDKVAGKADPHRKAITQITRSSGAALGSLLGGWIASRLGRRTTYFFISLAALIVSGVIYHTLTPTDPMFGLWTFALGFAGVAYFGWLPLYLPELFPTRVRSTGTGITFNAGRILAVPGVLGAGELIQMFDGDYARVGTVTSLIYVAGMLLAFVAPDTSKRKLAD